VLILTLKRVSYDKDTGCPQKVKKTISFDDRLTFDKRWLVDALESPEYELSAVICHHGENANKGHYHALVRYNQDWFMYDDLMIRQMEIQEVMGQMFTTAYILIYQCHGKVAIRP